MSPRLAVSPLAAITRADRGRSRAERSLRAFLLAAVLLVLGQAGLGMAVNLYVLVPSHHPGAQPASYLSGSYRSVSWALTAGSVTLAAHVALGLALVVVAIGVVVHALRARRGAVSLWSLLGGLLVVGAGFNGASFLDFDKSSSSLIMALLAFGAVASYVVALYLLGSRPRH